MGKHIVKVLMFCLALIHLSACSDVSPMAAGNADFSSSSPHGKIAIAPANPTVGAGETLQFRGIGGEAPYTFSIVGAGYMSPSGVYTAPQFILGDRMTVTVYVMDALGYVASTTLTIDNNSNALQTSYSPASPKINTPVTITVSGGDAPYTFALISGLGILNGNTYTTGLLGETAAIQVTDRMGRSKIVTIPVAGPHIAITAIGMTALNTHQIGGGGCAPGAAYLGSVADAGGNTIYGDQIFCAFAGVPAANTPVLSDIKVMDPGTNCPSNYHAIGEVRYCPNGRCSGTQKVCVAYRRSDIPGPTVVDFYVTPQSIRDPNGPACAAGYTRVGTSVNCANGSCSGLHSYCAAFHQ